MKKYLLVILRSLLHLFVCIIYAFLLSSFVIVLFNLEFWYFDKFFIVFLIGSYFIPPSADQIWQ